MLKIKAERVQEVQQATRAEELHHLVQSAIELEHATIPAYLSAYMTLKLGTNQPVAEIIRSIVIEEMLHMSIAANLLIAIGGRPQINKPGFVPHYPGPLPMNIGDVIVPLEKCSLALVRDVFMKIEEPEHPIPIPVELAAAPPEYETIGAFYMALDAKLQELGPPAFDKRQFDKEMVDNTWFPPNQLFRIVGPESASLAIQLIVRQGEGTRMSPLDPEAEPAHYYRFEQIVRGKRLTRTREGGFVFGGAPVALDERGVWNMQPNTDPDALPPGSLARRQVIQFAYAYTGVLDALHGTFNGRPEEIGRAMGLMYQLRLLAQNVFKVPLPGSADPSMCTGLSFRYQPTTAEAETAVAPSMQRELR